MLFNSFQFLIFFPLVFLLHYILPARFRWAWLLVASCYFYASYIPAYLLVLGALIIIDYCLARKMDGARIATKQWCLAASVVGNIGILVFFKYFNFFQTGIISSLAPLVGATYHPIIFTLLLPLGLSFHVFQSLSYVIEVYRGQAPAERHLGIYALYVMFFPQLVAGPIERPAELIPQLRAAKTFAYGRGVLGVRLIVWGFFKKLVVADQLGLFVDTVFNTVHRANGPLLLAAIIAFALELYGDFSGYTDIARGSAELLGITLVRNFNNPYSSRSIAEFWRRWHISLSSWFRDYFYFPFAFSLRRYPVIGGFISTVITFTLIGLWHGAAWTYVVMGALNGIYIVFGAVTKNFRNRLVSAIKLERLPRLHNFLQIAITFALVCVGWIFFRAHSLGDAFYILTHLNGGWDVILHPSTVVQLTSFDRIGIERYKVIEIAAFAALMLIVENWSGHLGLEKKLDSLPRGLRWCLYYLIAFSILFFGLMGTKPFIYFQF